MERPTTDSTIKLDWSRLLGFDRIARSAVSEPITELSDSRLTEVGAKVGIGGRCG